MAIKGATFDLQTVLAKYDGAMYSALSNGHDGYVSWNGGGQPISITDTNVMTLKSGYILVHGRLVVIDGNTDITLSPGSSISSGDGRLVLKIDTTVNNTQSQLNQVSILEEYKASGSSWRALTTTDINIVAGVYEVQLCHFTVSNGTSSGAVVDISTDTLIGNLQDDIQTLANALEDAFPVTVDRGGTGLTSTPSLLTNLASTSAAGIFQASPRPGVTGVLPITNGGTGATAKATALANLGGMPLLSYTSSDSWVSDNPNLTHIENIYAYAGKNAIVECNYTGSNYKFIAIVDWGNANYGGMLILSQRAGENVQTFRKGVSWYQTGVPRVMRWTFAPKVLTANTYQNYQVTGVTTLSGEAFSTSGAQAWNVVVNEAGLYRMDLTLTAPTGSGAIGVFTGHDATPNYNRPCQLIPLTTAIGRLSASGIISVSANEGLSLIVRCSTTTDELAGTMTLEKLS